jgi:hypothetical protein
VQQRKITGASAKVTDQKKFIVVQRGFVRVRGRDWLHLKVDRLEARMDKRLCKTLYSERMVLGCFGSYEADGTAHRGVTNWLAELLLRAMTQVGENARDQIFNRIAAAEDLCAGQAAAAEVRLERLDQPALVFGVQIVLDACRPGKALDLGSASLLVLLEVEDRAKRFGDTRSSREADHLHRAVWQREGYRAVRRAEVNANGEAGGVR